MPRKGKGVVDSCITPFHTLVSNVLVSGIYGLPCQPGSAFGTHIVVEADSWAHFRIKRLSFRLHPNNTTTATQVVGYIGGVQDTPPANIASIAELIPSTVLGGRTTRPTDWVHVPRVDLAGPFPWYKSLPGAADVTEESPGSIYVGGTSTDAFTLEIRGILEFKTAVATANTPMQVMLRERVRRERIEAARAVEKAQLLKILATTSGEKSIPPSDPRLG